MLAVTLTSQPLLPEHKYGLQLIQTDSPQPKNREVVVNIVAAALNHRDVWILKGMYPGIKVDSVLCSDAVGVQVSTGQRVLLNPGRGWDKDERAPEDTLYILGLLPCIGTLAESVAVDPLDLVPCPAHLSDIEAAALPLAGLTAYRALFTKANIRQGEHILITGIGGGVALFALQFAVAMGAHVYVTSSKQEKIQRAIALGAKGGVDYTQDNHVEQLKDLLQSHRFSAVIDGAGGPLHSQYHRLMRSGGIIANYGQTLGTGITYAMSYVMKNIEIKGTTLGSRQEFMDMVRLVDIYRIQPIVSDVFNGLSLESVYQAVSLLSQGDKFGKVVIAFDTSAHKL
ncbi:hypothetical protein BDF14DRAFT_1838702 [Spinellus fusiger]|nr:hypothetical protein BDF14DRAFT_1838702 [Spinellus fusiger]